MPQGVDHSPVSPSVLRAADGVRGENRLTEEPGCQTPDAVVSRLQSERQHRETEGGLGVRPPGGPETQGPPRDPQRPRGPQRPPETPRDPGPPETQGPPETPRDPGPPVLNQRCWRRLSEEP
ncbi:unnamed protein product [Gadus morhua 'NCC']